MRARRRAPPSPSGGRGRRRLGGGGGAGRAAARGSFVERAAAGAARPGRRGALRVRGSGQYALSPARMPARGPARDAYAAFAAAKESRPRFGGGEGLRFQARRASVLRPRRLARVRGVSAYVAWLVPLRERAEGGALLPAVHLRLGVPRVEG